MIETCVQKCRERGLARCLRGFFLVAAAVVCLVPGSAGSAAAIDEKMPATIPAEVIADWELQDKVATLGYSQAINAIISKLPPTYASKVAPGSSKEAYLEACHQRRVARMEAYAPQLQKVLYARHFDLGGAIIGFIEDMNGDRYSSPVQGAKFNFPAMSKGSKYTRGSALMIAEMSNYYATPTTLLSDATGVMRDPCLSYDGTKVAFAWSKDNNGYHIWELDIATNATTQLTQDPTGLTVSDFEPCYLPNGDIVFNSSRCFGQVDCNFNITCNLFLMNGKGKYLRRIGYDQVHTFYPTMMSTGKVLYCRWEYNDRNVSNIFGLFTMSIDGTHQIEYYGNQTSVPATLPQAREIPGTDGKIMATTAGHMGMYCGDLCIVDPNLGRNGRASCQLIAPKRTWPANAGMDGVPEETKLFQNPYPLDATWFLISYRVDINSKFQIYLMNVDGERELVASDAGMSVSQPIPLVPRPLPPITAYQVDYTKPTGEVKMTNAYYGLGTGSTVRAKTISRVRVIALEYRIYPWFGNTGASAYTSTPVARWMGSWEAKRIVGEMPVESDGSAAFLVPTRTPLYLQLIDTNGCAIQSMRSWMTLQPGEKFACYGCHEDKNVSPPPVPNPIASTAKPLAPFYSLANEYLSFPRHIQPILDKNCVSCHKAGHQSGLDLVGDTFWTGELTNDADNVTACRYWSKAYYNLTSGSGFSGGKYVNYITVMSGAEGLRPNSFGSGRSALITKLRPGHSNVKLTKEEMDKLCAWIDLCIPYSGHYAEGMKPTDSAAYMARVQSLRGTHEALEEANIKDFIANGQYGNAAIPYDGRKNPGNAVFSGAQIFKIRFSPTGRVLTAEVPCEGTLTLMDLSGRRIMVLRFTADDAKRISRIPLRNELPRGLYIIKFTGATVAGQRAVAVL
ncbi:MAG: hypothetical protein JW768_11325 [Chitinispirillaceae bacterium]|nr:hypothetical protein [Chitinispirillaceae bacterium]